MLSLKFSLKGGSLQGTQKRKDRRLPPTESGKRQALPPIARHEESECGAQIGGDGEHQHGPQHGDEHPGQGEPDRVFSAARELTTESSPPRSCAQGKPRPRLCMCT